MKSARELTVEIGKKHLLVAETATPKLPLINKNLFKEIRTETSTWSFESNEHEVLLSSLLTNRRNFTRDPMHFVGSTECPLVNKRAGGHPLPGGPRGRRPLQLARSCPVMLARGDVTAGNRSRATEPPPLALIYFLLLRLSVVLVETTFQVSLFHNLGYFQHPACFFS